MRRSYKGVANPAYLHGHSTRSKKRGPEYNAWSDLWKRLAKDPGYVGRVFACERWMSFENFLADMGERPGKGWSLERVDNDGNYEPSNCRWATRKEQNRNTRHNITLEWAGMAMCLSEWCEKAGRPFHLVYMRLYRGWPWPQALYTPKGQRL